jgi:8-oxo-dGTP pyrophosphatase MutT (NUDIX family)
LAFGVAAYSLSSVTSMAMTDLEEIKHLFLERSTASRSFRGEEQWNTTNESNTRSLRFAAVLIPMINHEDGITVLLTERSHTLSDHAGQVAFPGGQREPGDLTAEETALREATEEVGLEMNSIELLGRLTPRITGTGFYVVPVIGLVQPPLKTKIAALEVAQIFEVPLSHISNKKNFSLQSVESRTKTGEYWVMEHHTFFIWGLTARILRELSEVLSSS